jgi:hypothetical protein
VLLKTLTAQQAAPEPTEKPAEPESPPAPVQDKLSEGLRAYLNGAAIPGDKSIDVSVHLVQPMRADEVNKNLSALFGPDSARVNDPRTVLTSGSWVVRVKRGLVERFNQADWVTKVNRYWGEAQPYSANEAG